MYGVVIQANIISEILNEDYIDAISNFQEYLFAFIACILHIALLLLLQKKFPIWYDILALLLIVTQLFLLALIRLTFFYYNIKAELTVTLGTMAIAGFVVSQYPHFAKKEYWGRLVRKVRPGQTTLDTSNFSK